MKNAVLIDDDEVSNFVNSRLLLQTKLVDRVHSIQAPDEALNYFGEVNAGKEPVPFLVLVDIRMPVMDGFTLTDEIFSRYPGIRGKSLVYFLSSSLDPKDVARAEAGDFCRGFLRKPLSRSNLEDLLA
jgi:CheY-like chemotaxis protein